MNNIEFQYPTWYLLLCVALGIVFALALYLRDRRFRDQSQTLNLILGVIRGILVTLLAVLLLSPLIKSLYTQTQNPIVVLAQDVSESIFSEQKTDEKIAYLNELKALQNELGQNYDLMTYSFGDEVRRDLDTTFNDKASNLSQVLSAIYDQYSNQNLGAIILATDGIYNQGNNPIYSSTKLNVPIYSVALGDTLARRDLILRRAFYNKLAYLDDRFAVQVDITAQNSAGQQTQLVVSKVENGQLRQLITETISINQNDFFTTRELILTADQAGVQRYRLALSSVDGEASTQNNYRDIFVDVLDARQKILLLANSPHPDLSALKQSLSANKNYEITTAYVGEFQDNVAQYDFVILHQLPSLNNPATNILMSLQQQKIPHFYIVGSQTNISVFNQSQALLTIRGDGRNSDEVQPILKKEFSLFTIGEELFNDFRRYPPVIAPFGTYVANPNSSILMEQRIGRIDTERPLLLLGEDNGMKIGVLAAEGIWKWRLFDYLQNKTHDTFNEFLGKTIQYLSLKEDKRRFRINLEKNVFNENGSIVFDAELYNENYERINIPEANLSIRDEDGNNFDYIFNKTIDAYEINVGILPVGEYQYTGTANFNGRQLQADGQFSVQPVQLELYANMADHNLLKILSDQYGGELIYPGQLEQLPAQLEAKGTVKPVIYQSTRTRSVINLKWICFLLLGLLTVEWFLRRYFGAY